MTLTMDKTAPSKPVEDSGPGLLGVHKRNVPRLIIAGVLALTSLGPLLYMVSLSFQPNGGLLGATVLIPTHPTVQNYVQAWTETALAAISSTVLWWPSRRWRSRWCSLRWRLLRLLATRSH